MKFVRRLVMQKTDHLTLYVLGVALLVHAALFMLFRAASHPAMQVGLVPPKTAYAYISDSQMVPSEGNDARVVWSPVLFSFPSKMGFSKKLLKEELNTRSFLQKEKEAESFLVFENGSVGKYVAVPTEDLIISSERFSGPTLPRSPVQSQMPKLATPRVYIDPKLSERLEGDIELPAELNKGGEAFWRAIADVTVSEEGVVSHVFLRSPLQPPELNQSVLQAIYGLKFHPASEAVDGLVEISSVENAPNGASKND